MYGTGPVGAGAPIPFRKEDGVGARSLQDDSAAKEKKLERACSEFEALFLSHMLKSMRTTADVLGDGEEETGTGMMNEFADEQLALGLARKGGLGLADMLRTRLAPGSEAPVRRVTHEGAAMRRAILPSAVRPGIGGGSTAGIDAVVSRAAARFDLDPNLLHAVIAQESGGKADAVSPKGAKGLMQLMDGTARAMGVRDPFDAEQNVYGGARYLRTLLDRWEGDVKLALAAYNAGPSAVERHGGVPPYPETENYVRRVMDRIGGDGVSAW